MSLAASEVMDESAVILNDSAKSLYSYSTQLPYLKKANKELEMLLLTYGIPVQRTKSSVIQVNSSSSDIALTLPSDFLFPERLFERDRGATTSTWFPMSEFTWNPENVVAENNLRYWSFRNNNVYFPPVLVNKDVLLEYERKLAVITTSGDLEDFEASKTWLAARTAELCARYIGMNKTHADQIRDEDVAMAQDNLVRAFVLNQQGLPARRSRFSTKRVYGQ